MTLAVGLVTALWSGIAVISATQDAMDGGVERRPAVTAPSFVRSKLRALLGLVVLGTFLVVAALLAGVGVGTDGGWVGVPLRIAAYVDVYGLFAIVIGLLGWLYLGPS